MRDGIVNAWLSGDVRTELVGATGEGEQIGLVPDHGWRGLMPNSDICPDTPALTLSGR